MEIPHHNYYSYQFNAFQNLMICEKKYNNNKTTPPRNAMFIIYFYFTRLQAEYDWDYLYCLWYQYKSSSLGAPFLNSINENDLTRIMTRLVDHIEFHCITTEVYMRRMKYLYIDSFYNEMIVKPSPLNWWPNKDLTLEELHAAGWIKLKNTPTFVLIRFKRFLFWKEDLTKPYRVFITDKEFD